MKPAGLHYVTGAMEVLVAQRYETAGQCACCQRIKSK